jgi:hypothetical protein
LIGVFGNATQATMVNEKGLIFVSVFPFDSFIFFKVMNEIGPIEPQPEKSHFIKIRF